MKQCLAKIVCGFAAASLALALAACDDSSSASNVNGPENEEEISSESNGGESSANVESSATVTSSETSGNSSNSNGNSATSQNGGSSNSQNGGSSASTSSSSNSVETCFHLTDSNCRISEGCSPTPCMNGTRVLDCVTNSEYVCKSGSWQLAETCANISGVTGNDRWNCDEDDFTLLPDCKDNSITYMCVSNHWFKTEDCDPTKPNCGFDDYTICEKTMLKAYCLKTEWLDEPCDYGNDPGRFLYVYHNPDDPNDLGHTQVRYFCNASGNWEEENYGCSDPMKDCGNKIDKSDDHGILPDGAPCTNEGDQMTVSGYNYQCISKIWTRL
jgi:hypothetical protein